MEKYLIQGGNPLRGEVEISGAKNAAVAIIPAALMVEGVCRLENLPQISDVEMLLTILEHLGAKVSHVDQNTVDIDCTDVHFQDAPFELMRKIRASYYLIGAMLGRFGTAKTTMPGGCNFGVRPIDQHWVPAYWWKTDLFMPMPEKTAWWVRVSIWIRCPWAQP